ncbi:MAG: diguanylate cyclase [Chthonomonadales bacterium]
MKILVVEDDAVSQRILARMIEKLGHTPQIAPNGLAAWQLIQAEPCRIIISDWMMPEMDGLQLCRLVRSNIHDYYAYFILCTAKDHREDRLEGLQAGADDFLTKPLDPDELLARLGVAQRILKMQDDLRRHAEELEEIRDEMSAQNEELQETMSCVSAANLRFSQLFDGLPVPAYTYDAEGRIHEWNHAAEELYGWTGPKVFERPVWEVLVGPEDVETSKGIVTRVFKGERMVNLECCHFALDGRQIDVLLSTFPLRGPEGVITGAIAATMDVTERNRLRRELEQQLRRADALNEELKAANAALAESARTDGLTGLRNHRFFLSSLNDLFALSSRQNMELSLIMLDVDKFKDYNDTFGHPAGDDVLRTVSRILKENVRDCDTAARYGGEEFAVLLPGADAKQSIQIAERLRCAVEAHPWPLRPVTASFGIATRDMRMDHPSDLVKEADRALYHAKRSGRNRVLHSNWLCFQSADLPAPDIPENPPAPSLERTA